MITKVFAVMDVKAGFFNPPWFFASTGQAVRALADICADPSTLPGRHPADFALYEIGTYDDATGRFDQSGGLTHLASGVDLLPAAPPSGDLFQASRSNGSGEGARS